MLEMLSLFVHSHALAAYMKRSVDSLQPPHLLQRPASGRTHIVPKFKPKLRDIPYNHSITTPQPHIPLSMLFDHTQTIGPATATMASPNALPEALRTYLATCSSEHANQIIETLRQSADMKANNGPGSSKLSKRQRSKKAKREKCIATLAAVGPKRPLNSWMAFRSK